MTSVEPPQRILEWPLTHQELENKYMNNYESKFTTYLEHKYPLAEAEQQPLYKGPVWTFSKNNIVLNNLLLNIKTKPTEHKIQRLITRINEFEKELSDKQEEIDNEDDDIKKAELEYQKELIINLDLLEACKKYIAFDTFNKYGLGEKLLRRHYRPGGLQYTKGEESFYNTLLKSQTQKRAGKRKKKNTRQKSRKKKGGKKIKNKSIKKKCLKGGNGPMEGEIEVYRMTDLIVDKCYITVFNTRQEGDWRNRRYYSSLEPTYVGKYIKNTRWGYGDGSGITWTFFNDMTNEEVEVRGDYEGRTCFKEVECEDDKLKREKRKNMLALSKMLITDKTPTTMLEDQPNILEKINSYMGGKKKKSKKKKNKRR